MAGEASIRIEGLVKQFPDKGARPHELESWATQLVVMARDLCRLRLPRKTVLDRVSLEVQPGELFGLLGPNGAGKTTLIKLLTCLLYPDAGGGWVCGFDLRRQRHRIKSAVSLLPAQGWLGSLFYLSVRQNLQFYARLCGLPDKLAHSRIDEALERLEIGDKASELPWSLSAGQRQKVNLARVYLVRTPIVFLDEPTAHLDPRASRAVRTFVRDVLSRQFGQTIFLSTHYLHEAESMCDRVAILDAGHLVACGTLADLKRELQGEPAVELKLEGYTPPVGGALRALPGVREVFEQITDAAVGRATLRVALRDSGGLEVLLRGLAGEQVRVRSARPVEPSLEEVFFHRVGRRFE
jgi:ABC-2 type transport system ATP-binding protein